MQKIPTIYVRNADDPSRLTRTIHPDCQWVFDGEGVPTRKYDGTCVMLDENGKWWARREVKPGKPFPAVFRAVDKDEVTGKVQGWEPIERSPWAKQWQDAIEHDEDFWEEVVVLEGEDSDVGTYELCGPKINHNPEKFDHHVLCPHRYAEELKIPSDAYSPIEMVKAATALGWEGIVWHHSDGRMAKLKARDLGADGVRLSG